MKEYNILPWTQVALTGGFWKHWQDVVGEHTSKAIYERFAETGRIYAMKLEWKEGMPDKPHVFWDSDIAKWMEGSAYLLYYKEDAQLRERLETIIGYIEKGQTKEGYFNSAFLTLSPDRCFTDRTDHELYTAGHLIEAAVAHYESTGSRRFLDCMCRFADYIDLRFRKEKNTGFKTPGHQELELALIRLWNTTGEKKYLELSKYFVDTRGTDPAERVFSVKNGTWPADPPLHNQLLYNDTYAQDDAPARELPAAGGHAVRAMYFYSAMADLAEEYGDEQLQTACERLWSDSVHKKMYVTGGVSAERYGEAIGTEYVLPNDYAYAETCASVAMANFSQRMFRLEPDSRYTDMIERQMYNGALAGLSLDGKGFFYDNALLSRPKVSHFFEEIHALPLLPPTQRQELFECSCCPPNIYRFLAVLGQYFYSVHKETVYVHQYGQGTGTIRVGAEEIKICQETNYPWDGEICLHIHTPASVGAVIAVRIPGWCRSGVRIQVNGAEQDSAPIRGGYAYLEGNWKEGDRVMLSFPMEVVKLEGNPNIVEAGGKAALMRGPVVYCVEGADNEFNILDLTLGVIPEEMECSEIDIQGCRMLTLKGKGVIQDPEKWKDVLYRRYEKEYEEVAFTAIPYFAWANRGENDMTVWIKHVG